ncbi:hypothetical protein JWJ90_12095 [Desulfobulbus rhabdoformis]|uniref:hypothetical protein n=1 Tax=Desulfobulbus rhabdoformis TaxID=34032 RepID=UPI001965CD3E|nr:hypothetical protein [Desulfobulbus rhabdoformis]MBM9615021.1 hypothetical protein [Desulfobulbus rhabdoformis]
MDWEIISKLVVLYVGGFFTIMFGAIGLKFLFTTSHNYRQIHEISGSFSSALKGTNSAFNNGSRDNRKKAGLAIDLRTNTWIEQGTLSDDSLDSIFRS